MHQLEESILIQIRNGDEKAFETLFRSYFNQLLQYAREILKDHCAAEEIAEEIFLHLWENREKITIESSIRAYLFRSAYNKCINHLRHQKVQDRYKLFFLHHVTSEAYSSEYSFDYPLSGLINKEIENLVEKSIQKLPQQCREIFRLSRIEEMRNQKIAEQLGLSVSTVKTQISRALIKIRKDLQEVLPFFILILPLFS
jgi:RNA polymerase sigma-70 factor, ECF subfamily